MFDCDFWEGPEVEGRLKGIATLFIRRLGDHLMRGRIWEQFPHIFLSHKLIGNLKPEDWYSWVYQQLLKKDRIVTVECTPDQLMGIPVDIRSRVHLMVRVSCFSKNLLKPTDTIVLFNADDPHHPHTCTFGTMEETPVADYQNDVGHFFIVEGIDDIDQFKKRWDPAEPGLDQTVIQEIVLNCPPPIPAPDTNPATDFRRGTFPGKVDKYSMRKDDGAP